MFILQVELLPPLAPLQEAPGRNTSGGGGGRRGSQTGFEQTYNAIAPYEPFVAAPTSGYMAYRGISTAVTWANGTGKAAAIASATTTAANAAAAEAASRAALLLAPTDTALIAETIRLRDAATLARTELTAANNLTRAGYVSKFGIGGGWFGGLIKFCSILGAVFAVGELVNDHMKQDSIENERNQLALTISANPAFDRDDLRTRTRIAVEQGDFASLTHLIPNSCPDKQAMISQVQLLDERRKVAENNSTVSNWSLPIGIGLGIGLAIFTGPVGWFAILATVCSGVSLTNLASKLFRKSEPQMQQPGAAYA